MREDGGDSAGGGDFAGVDHDAEFEEGGVDYAGALGSEGGKGEDWGLACGAWRVG